MTSYGDTKAATQLLDINYDKISKFLKIQCLYNNDDVIIPVMTQHFMEIMMSNMLHIKGQL